MTADATQLHDLGRSLLQEGRAAEAERALGQAAALRTGAWDVLCDLGTAQLRQGNTQSAIASFAAALAAKPDAALAHFNLAIALADIGAFADAERAYRATLQYEPQLRPAIAALANLLCDLGQREEGLALFAQARALQPDDPLLDQAMALVALRYGELRAGFTAYEARFHATQFGLPVRPFTAPRWQGEDLSGRSILIWTEQGLGEEILSASMFAEVAAKVGTCTIECSERLAPLLQRSLPRAKIIVRRDPPDTASFDFQVPALSLARVLRTYFTHFPKHAGYLKADPALVTRLRAKYRARSGGKRIVGISWESASRHGGRKRLPLELWRPILDAPDVDFVSLQYGISPGSPYIAAADGKLFIDGEVNALESLEASAAQVAAMDLVITVSNTTAHLAGAQNVPVWTLLTAGPGSFWYWFRNRSDSPWYPSMRLWRQTAPGDWAPVVQGVARALVEQNP